MPPNEEPVPPYDEPDLPDEEPNIPELEPVRDERELPPAPPIDALPESWTEPPNTLGMSY